MHPALNYRQSRRSACDRCRGFKLRCERDQVNGRSCERCLKAQVVCTTSMGHPTQNFNSSKTNTPTLPSEYDESYFKLDRHSMPVLHKPSLSRIRKPLGSHGILRRHDNQALSSWREFDPYSYLESGNMVSGSNDLLSLQTGSYLSVTPEQWLEATPFWDSNFPTTTVDLNFLEPESHLGSELPVSDSFATGSLSSGSSAFLMNGVDSYPSNPLGHIVEEDVTWASSWKTRNAPAGDDDLRLTSSVFRNSTSSYGTQRRVLKLNLELIEDLELLEWESTAPSSTHFVGDSMTPTVSKLDVPVTRMLDHSVKLLEILESGRSPSETAAFYPGTESVQTYSHNITHLPSNPVKEEIMEDGIATVSSHDSGYLTAMVSPQDTSQVSPLKHNLPVFYTILTTYCHLIRLYHAIFTQLYQMFLIIPPLEDSRFLVLPSSQYGQMGMDGTLTAQVQALIELSFNMLAKLENALEFQSGCCSESDRPSSHPDSILDNTSLAAIRQQIVAHEGIISGIPLKETMDCLSQLVKASAET